MAYIVCTGREGVIFLLHYMSNTATLSAPVSKVI